jgi:hypothetical protein
VDQLLNGWDDLAVTRSKVGEIAAFKARDAVARPWARPINDARASQSIQAVARDGGSVAARGRDVD